MTLSPTYYDISIWEEIRSVVCWKNDQLVETINSEIQKDPSLAEFQGKYPVPLQLKEIMEHRANAWVQRLYDLCCEAYTSRGKTVSADFDRAIWFYRLEPFIMGETDSQVHDQRMRGFLNLLLCAVGSPPEKRSSLKVGEKQCCFLVRTRVFETWQEKLNHIPRIDEAVAAMARFNATERIVRGLPPDDPPPLPTTLANPLPQPEESETKPDTQTPPLHIDASLKKTVHVSQAPRPISEVGGRGTFSGPKPTEVLSDLPVDYPRTLVARSFVIIGEAARKFPVQTQTAELCRYVVAELTPHFRETLQNKGLRPDQAPSRMHGLLHYLLVYNCDSEWRRHEIRREVLRSDEWLMFAREMARAFDNDAPVRAGSIQQAQVAPESGSRETATWDTIEISFVSEERVQIRDGARSETLNYAELGFEDTRNGKPNRAWEAFRVLAAERGIIRNVVKTGGKWPGVEKRMQEIRKVLRKHFQISADPIPFVEDTGYQALFKISCRPSFDT